MSSPGEWSQEETQISVKEIERQERRLREELDAIFAYDRRWGVDKRHWTEKLDCIPTGEDE